MRIATEKEINGILETLKRKGYKIFTRPYELNIIGIRNDSVEPNKFDDTINVLFKDKNGKWQGYIFPATTDPGTYWLKNPSNVSGTALLKEGQYIDAYQIGLHQKSYQALVQRGEVTVIRDYDRDAFLDFKNGVEEKGFFGINIHRAGLSDTTKVDKWSAGCQVIQYSGDFDIFMALAERHSNLYGNKFTYTLIDKRSYNRSIKLKTAISVFLLGCLFFTGWYIYKNNRL
jgi:hypothetical protein